MEDAVIGRRSESDILAVKDENGDWVVTIIITESRKLTGDDWEKKNVSAMCTDKNFQKAYTVAMNSALEQINDILESTNQSSLFPDEKEVKEDTKE